MTLIRPLTPDDAATYHALRLEALAAEADSFVTTVEEQAGRSLEQVAKTLAETTVFGAFIDGELVGTAGYARNTPAKEAHKGLVWGMYLRASARGGGLAGALLDTVKRMQAEVQGQQILLGAQAGSGSSGAKDSASVISWVASPRPGAKGTSTS